MNQTAVKNLVREFVGDTIETYRFEDVEIFGQIEQAVYQLNLDRPDIFLNITGTMSKVSILNVGDEYQDPIVNWTCYKLLMKDGEDTQNLKLAAVCLQAYRDAIT